MGRRRVALVAAVVAALLAAGCSGSGGAAGDRDGDRRLRVVATTTQVADLAANVGGDRVRVTGLLKPGIDPHDYEPSPAGIDAIAHADLVLENGVGREAWLGDTIDGSGSTARWSTPARASGCAWSRARPTRTSGRTRATPSA